MIRRIILKGIRGLAEFRGGWFSPSRGPEARMPSRVEPALPMPEDSAGQTKDRDYGPLLRSSVVWVVSGRVLGVSATLIGNALLPRLLSQEAFADFSLAISFITFASVIAGFGLEVVEYEPCE